MTDAVNHPPHYGGKDNPYEVIKVLEAWMSRDEFIGFLKGNMIKYEARAAMKNGDEDHAKAAWYAIYLGEYVKRVPAVAEIDAALAKQLQRSMELTAKIKNALNGVIQELPIQDGALARKLRAVVGVAL